MGYKVAVVGATGNVGQEILSILAERDFPADSVVALASSRSKGREVSYGDEKILRCEVLDDFDFTGIDIALFSPGASVSKTFAPRAAAAGAIVIDNTSQFRMDPDCPLVVPEVNPDALANAFKSSTFKKIIANPNCSTIQMLVALKPIHETAKIKRLVVSTYQSVSGGGTEAMDELFNQTKSIFQNNPVVKEKFTKQIAFNVIPHIDVFMDDGATKEEWKMAAETKKILDPSIKVHANCARVPVFIGHSEYVNIETEEEISVERARKVWGKATGVVVVDHRADEGYVSPVECAGEDATYISRIREDFTVDNGLSFWCVSDNLRKGAALNAVQIAESLISQKLI
ncbi:MAG: aspartate-semialdehyde dehydrogenase [Alphaproteobacteria bacterium]